MYSRVIKFVKIRGDTKIQRRNVHFVMDIKTLTSAQKQHSMLPSFS